MNRTPSPALEAAYRATTYEAQTPEGPLQLRIDEPAPVLDALLGAGRTWAFITAWNPRSQPLSRTENRRRQQQLEAELRAAERTFFPGRGVPDDASWDAEESVLVVDIPRGEALALARRFEQNAILFGRTGEPPRLLWCDEASR